MSKSLYRLPFVAAALILVGGIMTWASPKSDWDEKAQKRKAEYIFLEAQNAYNLDNFDTYISLVERAYRLDSTDIDIAGEWAMVQLMDDNSDSTEIENAYRLLMRRFNVDPSNFYAGAMLANIAQRQLKFDDALHIWETLDSIYPTRPDIAQELAEAYLNSYVMGDSANVDKDMYFDKAMALYNRIQEGTGRTLELTSQKINAYYLIDDTLAIINELESLHEYAPNDSRTAQFIGAYYEYVQMPKEAIKYYNIACELDSTNGSAYLMRARFYHSHGDSIGFDREVFMALKSPNLDIDSKVGILRSYVSELYTDTTQEQRIKGLFNDLQQMHSGEPEIHSLYGSYLYEIKDYAGAADQFSYVTALTPNDEEAWNMYVQTAALAEDTITMEKVAAEAITKFPSSLYFPIALSMIYRMKGEDQRAIAVLDSVDLSVIKNDRIASNFLTSKGDLLASSGDTIKALDVYDEAIKLNPDNSMALNNAAYFIALIDGDLDKAERYSARSLHDDELNATYLDTYAWIFFKKKDYSMAKHYIDIALNSYNIESQKQAAPEDDSPDPDDEDELIEGEVEEEVNVIMPSADIFDHAGDIYFMNGEIDKAIEFWEKSYELDPTDALVEKKVKNKTIFLR